MTIIYFIYFALACVIVSPVAELINAKIDRPKVYRKRNKNFKVERWV